METIPKKELTPEEAEAAAKLEASREARKKAAEEAKAVKIAKAKGVKSNFKFKLVQSKPILIS
jgi:hypothetical protein